MKTIIQLLIAAIIVNGAARAGAAAWRFYQFRDSVLQEARFLRGTGNDLHQRILEIAEAQGIPIAYEDVAVDRQGDLVTVSAAYIDTIPLVPKVYTREQLVEFEVSARIVRPLTADDLQP